VAEHIWRWQNGWEHPKGRGYDTDGWYVCLACGANDWTADADDATPPQCPRDRPTAIVCTCTPPVHALTGVDHRP
jgi:hypothetical protein